MRYLITPLWITSVIYHLSTELSTISVDNMCYLTSYPQCTIWDIHRLWINLWITFKIIHRPLYAEIRVAPWSQGP